MAKKATKATKAKSGSRSRPLSLFPFQLADVRLYEISVDRCAPGDAAVTPTPVTIALKSQEPSQQKKEFGLLLTFDASFPLDEKPACNIHLAIEGIFRAVVDIKTVKPDVIQRFKSTEAMILFWPYLRQYLYDVTQRMKLPIPPLPIIDPFALAGAVSHDQAVRPETA
jgi:preprotein translocase subunit SecB